MTMTMTGGRGQDDDVRRVAGRDDGGWPRWDDDGRRRAMTDDNGWRAAGTTTTGTAGTKMDGNGAES
uniref:Uncharacterized protein n=1 Tax=Oryza sativa subsp. japonica TaxID=39947 RepID=Q7Y190_ORYSJ|nr:hypothetical protein [Oryza sativa Japonica Group]